MVKVPEMPIRQEKVLSSEFHMAMLQELESHHDEKSADWSTIDPMDMLLEASNRINEVIERPSMYTLYDAKQIVHAANYLTIAWAVIRSRNA